MCVEIKIVVNEMMVNAITVCTTHSSSTWRYNYGVYTILCTFILNNCVNTVSGRYK